MKLAGQSICYGVTVHAPTRGLIHSHTLSRTGHQQHAPLHHHPSSCQHHHQLHKRFVTLAATKGSKQPKVQSQPKSTQQQQQQPDRSSSSNDAADSTPEWVQQLQSKWDDLDTPQKAYAVVVGLAALVALPRVLTLAVLGVERVIIGGLLAAEEVLLELLFKAGALVSHTCVPLLLVRCT